MKRFLALCISIIIILASFTACGDNSTSENSVTQQSAVQSTAATSSAAIDPMGKYDQPITLTACRILTSWMGFDDGKDVNNNWWSQAYLDQLGIKLNVVWTATNWGEPFEQKYAVCMATNDLPDIMPAYGSIAAKLIAADKVYDLTKVYNDYASVELKKNYSYSDGLPLKNSTVNGKLIALPDPAAFEPASWMVWIRSDWLTKLNLKTPTTLAELENVAREFVAKKPDGQAGTYGFGLSKDLTEYDNAAMMFHAYKEWVNTGDKLEYGWIQPEQKNAMQKFADWYKEGLLSKEFAIKDPNNELQADVASGKVGILFDGDRAPNGGAMRALMKNNPKADWIWIPMPSADDKPVQMYQNSKVSDFNLVNKDCKNPEAVIKMMNLIAAVQGPSKPAFVTDNSYNTSPGGNMEFWNTVLRFGVIQGMSFSGPARDEIKNGGDGASLGIDQKAIYSQLKSWKTEGVNGKDFDLNWSIEKLFDYGGSVEYSNKLAENSDNLHFNAYYGFDTEGMGKYGGDLNTKHKEFFIKAIINNTVDQEFDNWVKYFNQNGGETITKEVNDWYAANK